jgi:hypothetical protein
MAQFSGENIGSGFLEVSGVVIKRFIKTNGIVAVIKERDMVFFTVSTKRMEEVFAI